MVGLPTMPPWFQPALAVFFHILTGLLLLRLPGDGVLLLFLLSYRERIA